MTVVAFHITDKGTFPFKIRIELRAITLDNIVMPAIISNDMLIYAHHAWPCDIQVNVNRGVNIRNLRREPHRIPAIAEPYDLAAEILMQEHPAKEAVNIRIDNDMSVFLK